MIGHFIEEYTLGGHFSLTELFQHIFDPSQIDSELSTTLGFERGWSDEYENFVLDEYDRKINIAQDAIARSALENPTVGIVGDPMADDMRKVDYLQKLRHFPATDPRSPFYGWSEQKIQNEITRILSLWGNGGRIM